MKQVQDSKKQRLFYPLLDEFDRKFFEKLKKGIRENYKFIGNSEEKEFFVKSLLCLQMMKDYRSPLVAIYENLSKEIDLNAINSEVKLKSFELDYSWAVWTRDKRMGELAEKILNSKLKIIATDKEFDEFAFRYLISIWLVGWEGILFILLDLAKSEEADLREMNKYLLKFDFTEIFTKK